jgi:hypothetical protein
MRCRRGSGQGSKYHKICAPALTGRRVRRYHYVWFVGQGFGVRSRSHVSGSPT